MTSPLPNYRVDAISSCDIGLSCRHLDILGYHIRTKRSVAAGSVVLEVNVLELLYGLLYDARVMRVDDEP